MGIIDRSYYDAAQQGRDDRQRQQTNALNQQISQASFDQGQYVNNLLRNPDTTPEQFARAGRSDISNSLNNIAGDQQQQKVEQAKRLAIAAEYGLRHPSPKAFIQQNFPDLVQAYGPEWATATDDDVKQGLSGIQAKFGAQAGIGPAPQPIQYETVNGPRGSRIQRNPVTNEEKQIVGPDNSQPSVGGGAPAGYRFRKDGGLEPIPGGPADPNTPSTKDDQRAFAKADKLRDEFNTASKDFISVGDSFNTVRAAAKDPTAAGDLSMIFAYMKMLDPNSVVREQEFANAQNAAGVPDQIRNQWNKIQNGERLNTDQRADFISQAEKVYKIRKQRNEGVVKRYTDIATRNKVNPQDVVGDLSVYENTPAQSAPNASQSAVPQSAPEQTATNPKTGQKVVFRNGQWVPL